MKKIFVITCKAKENSLKAPYVNAYIEAAQKAGNEIRCLNLYELEMDYLKFNGDKMDESLTEQQKQAQDNILWADQVVFVYPIWWLGIPAKFKSFIETVFQEGIFAKDSKMGPVPLLKDKTAVIMQSYDMPYFYMKYFCGDVAFKQLKMGLNWCGFKIVKRFDFDCISVASNAKKQKWIKAVRKFASKIK